MAPLVRYPSGPVTPHGAHHILRNRIPQMGLNSYDNTTVFNMLGGLAIADRTAPERVQIKQIKGLIPPWRTIDQKGATQDGVTFVDALYDPAEVTVDAQVIGRDPAHCRKVARALYDSLDVKKESELWWFTHDLGRWWAPVRQFKSPEDPVAGIKSRTQDVTLRLRADNAFWQSYPCVEEFSFTYEDMTDTFNFTDANDLGATWDIAYTGTGGNISANGSQAEWVAAGEATRVGVFRKNNFTTTTDNQVVNIVFGTFQEWNWQEGSYNDIWARVNNTGTAGTSGVRLRIAGGTIKLSYFVAGVETVLREYTIFNWETWIPPLIGEKFTLVAGYEGDPRMFKVLRNGSVIMSVKEPGTNSLIGASNRSVGFGMYAGAGAWFGQATPASIRKISAGDNATVSQEGFIRRVNVGDQDMWDNYTCFGPGTFKFWNGPGAGVDEYVEFGPLLPGQVMHLRTDPRKRGVTDMTSIPPSPQQLDFFQKALRDFLSFATGNNATPLAEEIESWFGVLPPQGNPYSLLRGRWSKPIPPKSPGKPAEIYPVKVSIDDGNADSKIIRSGYAETKDAVLMPDYTPEEWETGDTFEAADATAMSQEIDETEEEIEDFTAALALKAPLASPTFTGTVAGITKSMIELGNVDNTSDANKPVSTAQQTALDLKAPLASPTFTGTVAGVTKTHVGLGNVDNTSDANKPVSTAQQTALNLKANLASPTFTGTVAGITKSMVGLGSVDNTADTAKPVSTAQQTALDLKANLASPTFTGTVAGITKSMVGLGSVDNTADTAKPVSTAQQTALDLKANLASPTFTGTVAGITKSMVGLGSVDNTADTAKPVSTAQQTALDAKAPLDATLNAQTGTTYTLVAGDDGKVVTLNNASAITLTVPQNSAAAIPVGSYIEFIQLGAGQVTFAQGTGATLNSRGAALKINGQYGVAGLRKIATNTFVLTGDLTT